jgi:hypothetical protein
MRMIIMKKELFAVAVLLTVLTAGCANSNEDVANVDSSVSTDSASTETSNDAAIESSTEEADISGNDIEDISGNDVSGNDSDISGNSASDMDDVSGNDIVRTNVVNENVIKTEEIKAWKQNHEPVRGIYVTGAMAGTSGMDNLIQLVDDTELNTMVIDYKNDEGEITSDVYVKDMKQLMATLKDHGIYTIARIVCFKDPTLASERPELALMKSNGTAVTDGNGVAWVNPCKEEVWEYLTETAEQAAELGFDEIQYDYVRFPVGKDANEADYGVDLTDGVKQQMIEGFLTYATNRLHEKNIVVTADVFGTIIGSPEDTASVGQDYVNISATIDAICPMVYPSHYGPGNFGLDVPDAHPYETILNAMEKSSTELTAISDENRAIVRPWLQAFTATWVDGHISYNGEQIRQQIQAVYDAGYDEWILWNAANRYSSDGLLSE